MKRTGVYLTQADKKRAEYGVPVNEIVKNYPLGPGIYIVQVGEFWDTEVKPKEKAHGDTKSVRHTV